MANRRRDPAREVFWRKTLRRCASSGLSVRAFCRRERITESALYAWRRTIAERDGAAAPQPAFVPAVVADGSGGEAAAVVEASRRGVSVASAAARCGTSIAIELTDGCVLRLAGPNSAEQLADLIIALQSRGRR